jgi:tetratricopeptide (TPR) repeat protein
MINKEHIFTASELAQFSYRDLMDDRQDYIIETLNNIIHSNKASIEEKVLGFYSLGDIYRNYIVDLNKAIEYINTAIELASSTDISFNYILRGSLWENHLQLLELLGKTYELEEEIEKVINKYGNEEFKSNSYLHNAYKYKARIEYNRGSFKIALENLMDAQRYYPIKFYAKKLHVIEAADYKNEFENLELLLSRNVCNIKDWQM